VAFLPDTFHEINGVAHTSRQFEAFARRRQIPFLSIHCGPVTETVQDGPLTVMQLRRGPLSFPLDAMLDYDPMSLRYANRAETALRRFGADLIHVTGPGDMGTLGCYLSWKLKVPLVISWHTSLHEYAGRRLERLLGFAGPRVSNSAGYSAEKMSLAFLGWFYRRAKLVFAPNQELVQLMRSFTTRPVYLMQRGVETDLFTPAKRQRTDEIFRIGYVGRLTPEKNVQFLADIGAALESAGSRAFQFRIVGQGSEDAWLRANVPNAVLTGVLRGEQIAEEYANMDAFVFPSKTDTYGNVVAEALASGVPAVVMSEGGPKFLVDSGVNGFVASSDDHFIQCVSTLMLHRDQTSRMSEAARSSAYSLSWDGVFDKIYQAYRDCLDPASAANSVARIGI
jgi:glycosyltransferase involved in cell wall biosynthesis